jgi:hypothetical protein
MSEIRSYVFLAVFLLVGLVACGGQQSSTEAGADGASTAVAALAEAASPAKAEERGDAPSSEVLPSLTIVYTNNIDGEIEPCG